MQIMELYITRYNIISQRVTEVRHIYSTNQEWEV